MDKAKAVFFSIYEFCRAKFWVQFVYSVLIAAGPLSIGYSKLSTAEPQSKPEDIFKEENSPRIFAPLLIQKRNGPPFSTDLYYFFEENPRVALIAYFFPVLGIIVKVVGIQVEKKARLYRQVSDEGLVQLLTIFGEVVGKKMEALGNQVKEIPLEKIPAVCSAFPKASAQFAQVQSLMEGIYKCFRLNMPSDVELKVTLAGMENEIFSDFIYFLPLDMGPTTPIEKFRNRKSGFSNCAEKNTIIVLNDIRKKDASYVCDTQNPGSLICFPVYHRNLKRVLFVITLRANKPEIFSEGESKKYEFVLKAFAKRLLVEYNSSVLQSQNS